MACRDKCFKCLKLVKDGVQCVQCCKCENFIHSKCASLPDQVSEIVNSNPNLKWYCDICLKSSFDVDSLSKAFDSNHRELISKIDEISKVNVAIKVDIDSLKSMIDSNAHKIEKLDDTVFSKSLNELKNEMNVSWAGIVGREIKNNIEGVGVGVTSAIEKTLTKVDVMKEKENNVVLFNLTENDKVEADKNKIVSLIKNITNNVVGEKNILKIFRQGKKGSDEKYDRPIVVKFDSATSKLSVMKNLFKLKSMSDEFGKVSVSHDLTRELRSEFNALLAEAKLKESNDTNFLYKVRGPVGRWKMIKISKKAI